MRSPIAIVDVDRPDTWSRYRAGLCDTCAANCCTMPLEVQMADLVRLGSGDCNFLDPKTRLCTVYDQRPETCRLHPQKKSPKPIYCAYGRRGG